MEKDSKVTATAKSKAPEVLDKNLEEKVETAAKSSEEKAVEVKAEAKKEDLVIEKKAAETAKAPSKKPAPKKKIEKAEKPVKAKAPAKKKETVKKEPGEKMKVSTYIQYLGKEIEESELVEKVKENWIAQGNDEKNIKNLELYVKPEEGAVYYVVNGIPDSGKVDF